jgi:hypothetical protein
MMDVPYDNPPAFVYAIPGGFKRDPKQYGCAEPESDESDCSMSLSASKLIQSHQHFAVWISRYEHGTPHVRMFILHVKWAW